MVQLQLRNRGLGDSRVLEAMARVPREQFVPASYRSQAYEDRPLPIAEGQTISQPYIVALMLEAVQLRATDKVLEIGTGSGYVTALLAELGSFVFSMERHADLADSARKRLSDLGYQNLTVLTGDGSSGLASESPFDVILVSAAAREIPAQLITQLAEGGRMIIPVGTNDTQQLQFVRKLDGKAVIASRELVRFVPLI